MKKVIVLLSTYNGEKYIRKLLDSVLKQDEVNVDLLIRDDGSTDQTRDILHEYEEHNRNVKVLFSENIGVVKSFFKLMREADDADYYAFCDQDDIWDFDKMSVAVRSLERKNINKPQLYCCNARLIDKEDNVFCSRWHNEFKNSKRKYGALLENKATGCTMVFNQTALNMIKNKNDGFCYMHDWYLYMVCNFFGEVTYDEMPHISYRQHENNVVGATSSNGWKKYTKSVVNFICNDNIRFKMIQTFFTTYMDELQSEDREKIGRLLDCKKSILKRINVCFDKDYFDCTRLRNIKNRILIMSGKF